MKPPVDFEKLVQLPPATNGTGYPYRIKAKDLMQNFFYVAAVLSDKGPDGTGENGLVETQAVGQTGHAIRKISALKIPKGTMVNQMLRWTGSQWDLVPPPPSSGTHVLGSVAGQIQWMETEEC